MVKGRLFLIALIAFYSISFISAWVLNGTTYDINGTPLFNATINVTIYQSFGQLLGYNATYSNQTGWFNLNVTNNAVWMYKPVITHFENNKTDDSTPIDFIGQSLPSFPYQELQNGLNIDFYLRQAGTINITAVNETGSSVTFQYILKDEALGYPIEMNFQNYFSQKTIYVPRDRNYSIMILPNQSMPVRFNWNNFSATSFYNISTPSNNINLSRYNATTHTLHKQFNTSMNLIWVSGNIKNSTGQNLVWNEFTVIPFILETGNMLYLGDAGGMPYNMSAWRRNETGAQLWTDNYSSSTGFYNITLIGPAESADYLLFATARNGTDYYGGFRNISLNYSSAETQVSFTMRPLMSTDWNSSTSNITMNNAQDWNQVNISTARQGFNLVNSTGLISQLASHIEVTVDYTNYNATEFTFMLDTSQSGSANFYIPLINATGIKEMNVYSQMYSPKRVGTRSAAEILGNNNITLSQFNPGDIDGTDLSSSVYIALYKSNSTCDDPNPADSCLITNSENMDNFNPLKSIIGGGKLSFRMGLLSSGIIVHYVNVDMLASGPPDALFDDSATTSTSGDFESALRFGSLGPTIYDYVLISMPYIEGSSSQTGLDENAQVNVSLPFFYDENSSGVIDWNTPIWNASSNGTDVSLLASNYSHYDRYELEWGYLLNETSCATTSAATSFNYTRPCYIDRTNNRIWLRLPHFSGTKPSVTGSVIAASVDSGTPGASSGGAVTETKKTHSFAKITPGVAAIMKGFAADTAIKQIKIEVNSEAMNVKITVTKEAGKPAAVSVAKTGKVYQYLRIETENLTQSLKNATITVRVNKTWTEENNLEKENISLFKFNESEKKWNELTTAYASEEGAYYNYDIEVDSFSYFVIAEKSVAGTGDEEEIGIPEGEKKISGWIWIVVIAVVLILAIIAIKFRKR